MLAYGWTSLLLKFQLFSLLILLPSVFLLVPEYGLLVAPYFLLALAILNIFFKVSLMHKRLLTKEIWQWYLKDVGQPLLLMLGVAGGLNHMINFSTSPILAALSLLAIFGCVFLTGILAAQLVRPQVKNLVLRLARTYNG